MLLKLTHANVVWGIQVWGVHLWGAIPGGIPGGIPHSWGTTMTTKGPPQGKSQLNITAKNKWSVILTNAFLTRITDPCLTPRFTLKLSERSWFTLTTLYMAIRVPVFNDWPALAADSEFKGVSRESGILNWIKRFLQIKETEIAMEYHRLLCDLLGCEDCVRAGQPFLIGSLAGIREITLTEQCHSSLSKIITSKHFEVSVIPR